MRTPNTLTVVLADTHRTTVAIVHENEHIPYRRRTVHVKLTPEQLAQIEPRSTGWMSGEERFEEVVTCWLEADDG